jgi:Sugar (and other) transporter
MTYLPSKSVSDRSVGVWVYSSEVISLSWRSKGLGLAVAMQWLFDFVLLQVTPISIANIGWKTYVMCMFIMSRDDNH